MSLGQPRILFLTLTDDVGSERIVSEAGRRGAVCAVMGRPGAVAARSTRVLRHVPLPARGGPWAAALGLRGGLARAASDWGPDAVVPLDDMAAELARDIAAAPGTPAAVRSLLDRSLGDPRHYRIACSRARLIDRARTLGIRTPPQFAVRSFAEAEAGAAVLGYPVMVKREATCGGKGVALVRDGLSLALEVHAAAAKAAVKRALRGLVGFRPDRDGAAVTLQGHVEGVLAMRTVACLSGRVLDGMSLAAERLDPPGTGSSTVVRPLHHPEMAAAAGRLVAALGCSGFVSFDFILAPDGAAHLIEMNARPVGSTHLGARFGHDIVGAWLGSFPGFADAAPPDATAPPDAVALFPKEMGRDPESPALSDPRILHDVPWDEPHLVEAYRARLLRRHPGAGPLIARQLGPAARSGAAPALPGALPSGGLAERPT